MSNWLLENIAQKRTSALLLVDSIIKNQELSKEPRVVEYMELYNVAHVLELAILDMLLDDFKTYDDTQITMKKCALDAFQIMRALPLPEDPLKASNQILKMASFAVLGDHRADAARFMTQIRWQTPTPHPTDWKAYTSSTVVDVWLQLICNNSRKGCESILERVESFKKYQNHYEKIYLENMKTEYTKTVALELIGLYHLVLAAEVLTLYITQADGYDLDQIKELLRTHFDKTIEVCEYGQLVTLEPMARLLHASALHMITNTMES